MTRYFFDQLLFLQCDIGRFPCSVLQLCSGVLHAPKGKPGNYARLLPIQKKSLGILRGFERFHDVLMESRRPCRDPSGSCGAAAKIPGGGNVAKHSGFDVMLAIRKLNSQWLIGAKLGCQARRHAATTPLLPAAWTLPEREHGVAPTRKFDAVRSGAVLKSRPAPAFCVWCRGSTLSSSPCPIGWASLRSRLPRCSGCM